MSSTDNAEDLFPKDGIAETGIDLSAKQLPEPWHKPRKHWVRKLQLANLIAHLIDELHFDGRPFRYLTLPGRHFLDIREIHKVCVEKSIQLRFIGFDASRSDEAVTNISADEVFRLSNIHKASELRSDRLEQVGNRKSLAYESLLKCGNLDAANLDLCDSVARCDAGTSDTALEAILEIVRFQSEHRSEPWLLFLTTRADRATVNQTVLSKLLEIVYDNLNQNAGFKACAARTEVLIEEEISNEIGGVVCGGPGALDSFRV